MPDSSQSFFLGMSTNAPEVVQVYIRALEAAKAAGADVGQVFQGAASRITAGADATTSSLLKLKAAAEALKQANAAVATVGPARTLPQYADPAATFKTSPVPTSYAEGLRAAEQAAKGASAATTIFTQDLIKEAFAANNAAKALELAAAASLKAGPSLSLAQGANLQRITAAGGAGSPLGVRGGGAILGTNYYDVQGDRGRRFPGGIEDLRTQMALNDVLGGRAAQLRLLAAENNKLLSVSEAGLRVESTINAILGSRGTQLQQLVVATQAQAAAAEKVAVAQAQAATNAAMAQAKAQVLLQNKAASPFYTSGLAGGGGGGGGGGGPQYGGFLGGRGNLFEQIVSTARISALYGGMYTALFALSGFLHQSIQSFSSFQVSIQDLADITGQSASEVTDFASSIADIGAQFGVASDAAIRVAAQTKGIDPNASDLAVREAVKAVSETAMVTGQAAEEISQSANAVAVAYGVSAQTVLDASNTFDRKLGVLQPTLGGQGRVAVLAEQAGISQPELSAMFALLSARLNRSPEDIAGALGQVLSRTDIVDLTELGATAGKSFADQLKEVGKLAPGISDSQLTAIANKFGRGSSGQTALELFRQMPAIQRLAGQPTEGRTAELAATRMRTFSGAMTVLQGSFEKLANTIGRTGVLSGLVALALAAKTVADILNALLKPLTLIPGPIRDLGFAAAEAAAILALLGRSAAIKAIAQGVAGQAAGSGLGAAALSTRLGFARLGSGLLSFGRLFGPLGAGITATTLAFSTLKDTADTSKQAQDNFKKALDDSSSSSKDLAVAAQQSADVLSEQSLINRVGPSQQGSFQNFADLSNKIADIKLTPTGIVSTATAQLDTGDVSTAFQQLVKDGSSAAAALRAVVAAGAIKAGGTIAGATGGGIEERAKTELTKIAGILQAGIPGEEIRAGGVGPKLWQAKDIQYNLTDEGKAAIDQAKNAILQKIQSGQVLTAKDLNDYIDAVIKAYGVPPEFQEKARAALRASTQGSLKNIEGLSNLLSDQTFLIVNKYTDEINKATSGLLANVPKAAGKDLKFQPIETERLFKSLAEGKTNLLQKGSKVLVIQQEINALRSQMDVALAMDDMDEYARIIELLQTAENQLATELIQPAIKLLNATFGNLTVEGKSKAEIKAMTNSIVALIPKIASSGDAMVALITELDAATRGMVRAKLIAAIDVAKAAVASSKKALEGYSIGGPYAFIGDLANALEGRNKVSDALLKDQADLAKAQKNLEEFDKAMSASPRGTASDAYKTPKAPKEKKPAEEKKDTQAQIDAAKALAEATKVQDPVKIAAAQLQVAQADLAAVAAESGRNSVAYWNAMAGVYKAMQDLADAQVQAAHQARLLGIDLTDPVAQARAETQLALDHLNSLIAQGASGNALNPAQVDVRQKQAAEQAAAFQQMFGDLQTNESLKRISHQEFIRSVQAERDRLAAQRSLLNASSNMYRQLTDEINQLDQALMQASESMNTMFNLGDIKIPTVYEVRRFMDSAFEGLNFLGAGMQDQINGAPQRVLLGGANAAVQPGGAVAPIDNRNVVINVNGGDLAAVQAVVMDAAGVDQQVVGARPHKF